MIGYGLIKEVRTRQNYTRVTFTDDMTVYVYKHYTDYSFYGHNALKRAEQFRGLHRGARWAPSSANGDGTNIVRIMNK